MREAGELEQAAARAGGPGRPGGELPAPPWQRAPKRAPRRRRDPITVEAIIGVALRLLDSEGLEGLSMRRVAEELDTGAASLYWHVGSKDGLLDLVFDHVIGEQVVPDPDPARWQEQLKQVARMQRAAIQRHRDLVAISLGRIPVGPNALRYTERVLGILRAGGVPDQLAVTGYLMLIRTVNGFTIDEADALKPAGDGAPASSPSPDDVSGFLASLPTGQFPNLTAVAGQFAAADPNEQFELLIDIFVDGLVKRARPGER